MVEVLPGAPSKVAFEWGARVLERDLSGGIYRTFLKVSSPKFLLKMYGRIWGLYQGTGRLVVLTEGKNSAQFLCYGLHQPSPVIAHGTMGACVSIIRLTGGSDVQHRLIAGGGAKDQYFEFELSWM